MTLRHSLARYAPCIIAICVLGMLASTATAATSNDTTAQEILGAGKDQISGLSNTVALIIKIVIGLGALVGLGIVIWGSVVQFNIMKLISGLGIIIACVVGWIIIDKIKDKTAAQTSIERRADTVVQS